MQSNSEDKNGSLSSDARPEPHELPFAGAPGQSPASNQRSLMKRREGSAEPYDAVTSRAEPAASANADPVAQPSTSAGGNRQPPAGPGLPSATASDDDEPAPPAFDVEAFAAEALAEVRGAKTVNEVLRLQDEIRRLVELRVPMSRIHAGLLKQRLITSKKSRFEAIVRDKLGDILPPRHRARG